MRLELSKRSHTLLLMCALQIQHTEYTHTYLALTSEKLGNRLRGIKQTIDIIDTHRCIENVEIAYYIAFAVILYESVSVCVSP